jgi:uncharacterized membrane protein (DUF106 family)
MGRASQVFGYIFGLIILLIGLGLTIAPFLQPLLFLGGFLIIGVLVTIFGFVIMYLGHRSRPTKEKKMLKMQAEEYLREQKMKKEMEKRKIEEMEEAEKERKKLAKEMEKAQKEKEKAEKRREKE